jgi:hypothetical protein
LGGGEAGEWLLERMVGDWLFEGIWTIGMTMGEGIKAIPDQGYYEIMAKKGPFEMQPIKKLRTIFRNKGTIL